MIDFGEEIARLEQLVRALEAENVKLRTDNRHLGAAYIRLADGDRDLRRVLYPEGKYA